MQSGGLPPGTRIAPSLHAWIPEGWFAKESFTLLAADGTANVIVSSEPLDPGIDTKRYAEVQGDLLRREFPDYHEISFFPTEVFGGKGGFRRRFDWHPPDGVPISQVQAYYAERGRGYTGTATTPRSHIERLEPLLEYMLATVQIGDPGSMGTFPSPPERATFVGASAAGPPGEAGRSTVCGECGNTIDVGLTYSHCGRCGRAVHLTCAPAHDRRDCAPPAGE